MNTALRRMLTPSCLLLLAAAAQAEPMKPGLWEISQKMQSGSGQMEAAMAEMNKQMAAMTPAQRKAMQDAMGKHGVEMKGQGAQPMAVRICVTKEMAARNEVAPVDGNCKSSQSPRVGNSMKFSFSCTNPSSSGEGEVTFVGSSSYSSRLDMKTVVNGKPETLKMDSTGKWIGTDCGSVKPPALPKP